MLILLDPTSAVDAHTEARIAERLRAARAGRTTVVIATSPLLLGRTDVVAHLRGGRVAATGTHADLLDRDPGYRALVARGSADPDVERPPTPRRRTGDPAAGRRPRAPCAARCGT